nr:hypothetical protein [Tanacetum cinerariifolium]
MVQRPKLYTKVKSDFGQPSSGSPFWPPFSNRNELVYHPVDPKVVNNGFDGIQMKVLDDEDLPHGGTMWILFATPLKVVKRNGGNNGCSYKTFLACNPRNYDGKGGAVAITRWIKKMKYLIENSGCAENQKVKYVASSFINKALTWWNTQFHELANLVPHLVNPESKHISAILKAGILTDKVVRCGTLTRSSEKRKEVEKTSKQGGSWKDNKREKVGKGFVMTSPPRNENVSSYPKCAKCSAYHPEGGPCSVNAVDALQDPNVVTGTFSLIDHFATILFDFGSDFSFISTKYAPLLNVKPSIVSPCYIIEVANAKKEEVDRIIHDCKLELGNSLFIIDLIPLGHGSFNVIVGMDWLSKNKAEIVCQ